MHRVSTPRRIQNPTSFLPNLQNSFNAVLDVHFFIDIVAMRFDGFDGNKQIFADFLHFFAFAKFFQYLFFALGQVVVVGNRMVLRRAFEGLDDFSRNPCTHRCAAVVEFDDGVQNTGIACIFEQIARCA